MREVKSIWITTKGLDSIDVPFPENCYTLQEAAELIIYYIYELGLEVTNIRYGTMKQEDIEL